MRVLACVAFALLPIGSSSAQTGPNSPGSGEDGAAALNPADGMDPMNLYRTRPGCVSIPRQVAGEDREYRGTRLDQLPPGKLLLAVERRVDGCPEIVLASEERRRERDRLAR